MNGVGNGLRLPASTLATRLRPEIVLPDLLESQGMSLGLPLFVGVGGTAQPLSPLPFISSQFQSQIPGQP